MRRRHCLGCLNCWGYVVVGHCWLQSSTHLLFSLSLPIYLHCLSALPSNNFSLRCHQWCKVKGKSMARCKKRNVRKAQQRRWRWSILHTNQLTVMPGHGHGHGRGRGHGHGAAGTSSAAAPAALWMHAKCPMDVTDIKYWHCCCCCCCCTYCCCCSYCNCYFCCCCCYCCWWWCCLCLVRLLLVKKSCKCPR